MCFPRVTFSFYSHSEQDRSRHCDRNFEHSLNIQNLVIHVKKKCYYRYTLHGNKFSVSNLTFEGNRFFFFAVLKRRKKIRKLFSAYHCDVIFKPMLVTSWNSLSGTLISRRVHLLFLINTPAQWCEFLLGRIWTSTPPSMSIKYSSIWADVSMFTTYLTRENTE